MQNDHLRARHANKKKDRTTEFRKWQSHGVKLIKHDEALKELKKILKRMNYWAAGLHNAVDGARDYDAPEQSQI